MAKSTNVKAPPTEPEQKAKPATKAQAEYERYKAQGGAAQGGYGFAPIQGYQAVMYPAGYPQTGRAGPGWPFPPSVAALPQSPMSAGVYAPPQASGESLADQLGSTLRLGVDAVNAMLVGGIRVLTGFSAYGAGGEHSCAGSHGCSCGSCCDPCETECGGYDCCCVFGGSCCQPSVGNCC